MTIYGFDRGTNGYAAADLGERVAVYTSMKSPLSSTFSASPRGKSLSPRAPLLHSLGHAETRRTRRVHDTLVGYDTRGTYYITAACKGNISGEGIVMDGSYFRLERKR